LIHEHPGTGLAESTARKRAATLVRWRDRVGDTAAKTVLASQHSDRNRLLVVQLSDIHIRTQDDLERLVARAPSIAGAIAARSETFVIFAGILILSGDFAFSETAEQSQWSQTWLESVSPQLAERYPGLPLHFFLAPGNHDCDFDRHTKMRERLITDADP